ncbi:type I restriction enzyme HsdR N-terminal domain-containing protein [Halorussus pelagicus]|uniref:type I restriction enzyme HsdR N-terminal domain-containing protein n=1 Tax=Halorussus pelagicus TaxID=2505977 RepID=UPI00140D7FD1|nr:type I restriction enzyme HsdR N-terminal domain-containing protein [Halorussus pelagicus]
MDEANTKAKLVRDLIELLDWDFATDVELEYPVPMATRTYKVDYALLLEDTPVVFVEAKSSDSSLSDDHREQLRSYMRNQNIDWGLLTNGRENEIYQRHVENAKVTVERLGSAKIDELSQKSNLLSALSKQSIETGEAEQIAQRITEIEQAKDELRDNKEEIAEEVARTIAERVGDSISKQAENEAKTLVDNLVAELKEEAEAGYAEPDTSDGFWAEVEREIGIVKQDGNIILQEQKSGASQLQAFVNFLLRQGYLEETDVPIPMGRKRYLVNTGPVDQQGDKMKRPKQLENGLFVEANQKTEQIKQNILYLGEQYS